MLLEKVKPLSKGQERLLRALSNDRNEIVGVFGPTGTGKSLLTCAYAIDATLQGRYHRFVLVRPIIDVTSGKELTIVELGEMFYETASSYLRDVLKGIIDFEDVKKLIKEGRLVIADSHFLRGRTFDEDIIFLDDAQNLKPESACEVLMRIGRGSKFVVAGDPIFQKDIPLEKDGATLIRESLLGEERAEVVDLGLKDIARPGALRGIRLLLEVKMRKREMNDNEQRVFDIIKEKAPDADVLTIIDLRSAKQKYDIRSEHVPDVLIIAKTGHLGRVVGKGGERIQAIEKDLALRARVIELSLDFIELLTAIHPVPWAVNQIIDVDLAGTELQIVIRRKGMGPFMGQRAKHIKFVEDIIKRLIGTGVRVREYMRRY